MLYYFLYAILFCSCKRRITMEKSKVYYTDFRAKLGEGLPLKLQRLIRTAGIDQIDM